MFISESFGLFSVYVSMLFEKKDSLYPLFDFLRSMFLLIKSSYSLFIEITYNFLFEENTCTKIMKCTRNKIW